MDDELLHLVNTGSFTGVVLYLAAQWFRQRRNGNNNRNSNGKTSGNSNGTAVKIVSDKLDVAMADSVRRFDTVHKRIDGVQDKQVDHGERLSKIEGKMEEVLVHVRKGQP